MKFTAAADLRLREITAAVEVVLCVALVAVVIAYLPSTPARPELFFLPKQFLASICAIGVAGLLVMARWKFDWIDTAAAGVLVVGVVATLVAATDVASAWRAIGLTAAATTLFWAARGVGPGRAVSATIAITAFVAGVSLLQAYQLFPDFSLTNRRPGATLGNRNELARLLVLATPLAWRQATIAVRKRSVFLAHFAIFLFGAVITLSRARTAWIAAAVLLGAAVVWMLHRATPKRARKVTAMCIGSFGLGSAVAVMVPSSLNWVSPSPFRDTARSALSFDSGSALGRVVQFRTTLKMASRYPVVGVGPGNWVLQYPRFASPGDPSYRPDTPFPVDRIPQSDVSGVLAEYGVIGAMFAALLWTLLIRKAVRTKDESFDVPDLTRRGALISTVVIVLLMSIADPILQLPAGAVLCSVILGAFAPRKTPQIDGTLRRSTSRVVLLATRGTIVITVVVLVAGLFFTSRRLRSTITLTNASLLATFDRAVSEDPSNYEARLAAAYWLGRAGHCDRAWLHLAKASRLWPAAQPERFIADQCRLPTP